MDVNQTMRLGLKRQRKVKQKYLMCQYLDFQKMKFLEQNGSGGYLIRISKLQKIHVFVSSTFIVKMCWLRKYSLLTMDTQK